MEAGQVQSRPGRAGQLLCVSVSSHCQVLRAEAAARARPGRGPRQRVAPSLSLPWRLQPPATRSLRRTRSSSGLGRKPPNVAAERAECVDRAPLPQPPPPHPARAQGMLGRCPLGFFLPPPGGGSGASSVSFLCLNGHDVASAGVIFSPET